MSASKTSKRLLALAEAGRAIAVAPDASALARAVVEAVEDLLSVTATGVLTCTEDGDHLELLAGFGFRLHVTEVTGAPSGAGSGPSSRCAVTPGSAVGGRESRLIGMRERSTRTSRGSRRLSEFGAEEPT